MVKKSIEQDLRNRNFGARNGNYERNAVVKNQGKKQRGQRIFGDCWQWEANGQCSKGDNCSFRHDVNKRAKMTQPNPSPNSFMQQDVPDHRRGVSDYWKVAAESGRRLCWMSTRWFVLTTTSCAGGWQLVQCTMFFGRVCEKLAWIIVLQPHSGASLHFQGLWSYLHWEHMGLVG